MLLNIDKDHKEIDALMEIFTVFKNNSKKFVVNQSHSLAKTLSGNRDEDFSIDEKFPAKYLAKDFRQDGLGIQFTIDNSAFTIKALGKHNMENATAAIAIANQI